VCWCYVLRWIWCVWCYSAGVYILQWTLILSPPLLFRFDSFPHIFTTSASKACT
jgi:hypothetical protein